MLFHKLATAKMCAHTHMYTHTLMHAPPTHIHTHTHACMCACTPTQIWKHMLACAYTQTYTHTHACENIHTHQTKKVQKKQTKIAQVFWKLWQIYTKKWERGRYGRCVFRSVGRGMLLVFCYTIFCAHLGERGKRVAMMHCSVTLLIKVYKIIVLLIFCC